MSDEDTIIVPIGEPLISVISEMAAQDMQWGEQNHPDGTGQPGSAFNADDARRTCQLAAESGYVTWRHILDEEVSEAFAETDQAKLRTELVQVAAVALNWVAAIDRRTAAVQ